MTHSYFGDSVVIRHFEHTWLKVYILVVVLKLRNPGLLTWKLCGPLTDLAKTRENIRCTLKALVTEMRPILMFALSSAGATIAAGTFLIATLIQVVRGVSISFGKKYSWHLE